MTAVSVMIVAEFIGGPRDGEVMALPDLRDQWLFPVPAPLTFAVNLVKYGATDAMRCLIYDLALDPEMGRPSLNDKGHYRYRFAGQR